MAVYVDRLRDYPRKAALGKWPYHESCHMTADTLAELHKMAWRLCLRRSWFQDHPRYPHYDLTKNKRVQAVAAGAIERRRPGKGRKL